MKDFVLLVAVSLAFLAFMAIETGGLTLRGWHTISYLAHQHLWLKALLTVAILALAPLFWWHASQDIPR